MIHKFSYSWKPYIDQEKVSAAGLPEKERSGEEIERAWNKVRYDGNRNPNVLFHEGNERQHC
jgi:hypothetical protein